MKIRVQSGSLGLRRTVAGCADQFGMVGAFLTIAFELIPSMERRYGGGISDDRP